MGVEQVIDRFMKIPTEMPLVPPGFGPDASFISKDIHESLKSDVEQIFTSADVNPTRSRRYKPCVNYASFDCSSDDSVSEELDEEIISKNCLEKGVVRGCPMCAKCQKVTARWFPEDAQRPILDEAPVFYPSEEEFKDTLKYISNIRSKAEPYGICRIVPPSSWNPPCPLKENGFWENNKFPTRIQQIDKLQNRDSLKITLKKIEMLKKKRRKLTRKGLDSDREFIEISEAGYLNDNIETFGFMPGLEFSLADFKKYADYFKDQYFDPKNMFSDSTCNQNNISRQMGLSVEDIEGEYWRIVLKPTEEIEVLYGADVETGVFGSGFPKAAPDSANCDRTSHYVKSGWNLNNFSKIPGSLLCFEAGDISGVLVPWLYIGMCFSSFCWHVEDHHLYSLNYMHWGAPKVWYGVPGMEALKFEAAMKKHLPDLFEEQPDLLHKLVTQLSPSLLKLEGVPVYRCVQNPREFVLTFPRAYHSGFNCGFNCAEAVNVAPIDWLPHGQIAVEHYSEQRRKTTLSHDKLLLGAAREVVKAHWELALLRKVTADNLKWKDIGGKEGTLAKVLKARVEMERQRRENMWKPSQSKKMDSDFDSTSERECAVCFYDLHLSAAGCQCSPNKYVCLNHINQLCLCPLTSRIFLFRYEINELNILLEALGGKLSAVYRWAYLDLGLTLSSHISKRNLQKSNGNEKGLIDNSVSALSAVEVFKEDEPKVLQAAGMNACVTTTDPSQALIKSSVKMESKEEDCKPFLNKGCLVSDSNALRNSISQHSHEEDKLSSSSSCIGFYEGSSHFVANQNNEYSNVSTKNDHNEVILKGSVPLLDDEKSNLIVLSDDENEPTLEKEKEDISRNVTNSDDGLRMFDCPDKINSPDKINKNSEVCFVNNEEVSTRIIHSENQVTLCNHPKSQVVYPPVTNASTIYEGDAGSLPETLASGELKNETVDCDSRCENCPATRSLSCSLSCKIKSRTNSATLSEELLSLGDLGGEQLDILENEKITSSIPVKNRASSMMKNQPCVPNNLDKYYRQKGPRIAKVVRKINWSVDPLEFGVVLPGKLWSNSQTIFPKGFRSRVKYISVLDPTQMCHYVSEILEAGMLGPLFMVQVEHCPSELFIHVSPGKCWDMVRERVNQEIRKLHSLGRTSTLPLQLPGSIDGLGMLGLSSPAIIQVIEAMDTNRVCTEYWKFRPRTIPCQSFDANPNEEDNIVNEKSTDRSDRDDILIALFKRATREELRALHNLLTDAESDSSRSTAVQLLDEEIQQHRGK